MSEPLTFGSLFSGIGGLDKGMEDAGLKCAWQCEINPACRKVLKLHWPYTEIFKDVRDLCRRLPERVGILIGGDPCPKHSRARSNGKSIHPDLSGYFLSLAGRLNPEWVVRENVPAPTVNNFCTCLERLGYGAVIIRIESSPLTGQLRQRDYIVGRYQAPRWSVRELFSDCTNGPGAYTTRLGTRPVTPALTTHRTRYDSRDCYIWEFTSGLRILDSDEREALAGLSPGWTARFSSATRARMCGNSAPPAVAKWIGARIKSAMLTAAALLALSLSGCTLKPAMSNIDIVNETAFCNEHGMNVQTLHDDTGRTYIVQCEPREPK